MVAGQPLALRSNEFDLLCMFARHLGLLLDRDRLLDAAWSYEYAGGTRTVDVHVAHLCDRLAGPSLPIETVRGAGYKLILTAQD